MNMDESADMVLESAGMTMVCASIEGVTEIERGFTGNFQFVTDEDLISKLGSRELHTSMDIILDKNRQLNDILWIGEVSTIENLPIYNTS